MNDSSGRDPGELRFERVLADYLLRIDAGQPPDREEFCAAHPDLADQLRAYFREQDRMQQLVTPAPASEPKAPADPALPIGFELGPYQIESVLGFGGMGTVYRAVHRKLDRVVAIKVLPQRLARDTQFIDRFQREARALARLDHEYIVRIHDLSRQGDLLYFAMEYVEGVDLRRLQQTGEMSPAVALSLVPKICEALEYAHGKGIVHRDIKPENILIDLDGNPKIADFGLARVMHGDRHLRLTRSDAVMGTLNYMAPEQARSPAVDHRADIYALGVVLYEMLTGNLPLGRFDLPSKRIEVDVRIDEVVARALETEPQRRYQRASDMGRDVSEVLSAATGPGPALTPAKPHPARIVRIVTTDQGEGLGEGPCAWLRIVALSTQRLTVRGWSRPQVGVTLQPLRRGEMVAVDPVEEEFQACHPWLANGDGAVGPGLQLQIALAIATIHVPEDLPVTIGGQSHDIKVFGTRSPLRVESGVGLVTIADHEGTLRVERIGEGKAYAFGLRCPALDVETQTGRILLCDLALRGEGTVQSQEGAIYLGGNAEENDYAYEARTSLGSFSDAMKSASGPSQGRFGEGAGILRVRSQGGNVRVLPRRRILRKIFLQEQRGAFFVLVACTVLAVYAGIGGNQEALIWLVVIAVLAFCHLTEAHRKILGRD